MGNSRRVRRRSRTRPKARARPVVLGGPPAPWGRGAIDPSVPTGRYSDDSWRKSRPPWSFVVIGTIVVGGVAAAASFVLGRLA
jgi:hypothetical protein